MPTITNTTWIPSPYRILSRRKFFLASLPCTRIFQKASLAPKFLAVACSSSEGRDNNGGSDFKDTVSGVVDEQVEELLSKEENRVLLDGLEKASQRVEIAKRELAEIERQELAAKQFRDYINQVEGRASEIAECQREILEAKAMVEEAERSLLVNESVLENGDGFMGRESDKIDKDEERWESIKAASVSAIVGTLAGLPITFTQVTSSPQLILPLAINFLSCALFGVTFRYTVRRDLDNFQLKTGTSAAFAFVKGLATLNGGPPLEPNSGSLLSHALDGAIYVSENLFIFIFAAVGLDYCFKTRLLSPFTINKSVQRTNSK